MAGRKHTVTSQEVRSRKKTIDEKSNRSERERHSHFKTIDDALSLSTAFSFYAVVDIKSAYSSFPSYLVTGSYRASGGALVMITSSVFYHLFLCFGLSNVPGIFQKISSGIAKRLIPEATAQKPTWTIFLSWP